MAATMRKCCTATIAKFLKKNNHSNLVLLRLCSSNSSEVTKVEVEDNSDEIDDEIELLRDVSRLTPRQAAMLDHRPEIFPPRERWEITITNQRKLFTKFGKSSGIDPSILWPSRDELKKIVEEEKEWEPTLNERIQEHLNEKENENLYRSGRIAKVNKAMEKMPQMIKEFEKRKDKVAEGIRQQELKKQKLLHEAREYFGYEVDPKDPKFKELKEMKELEMKKLAKQKKKEDKLAKLAASMTQDGGS